MRDYSNSTSIFLLVLLTCHSALGEETNCDDIYKELVTTSYEIENWEYYPKLD